MKMRLDGTPLNLFARGIIEFRTICRQSICKIKHLKRLNKCRKLFKMLSSPSRRRAMHSFRRIEYLDSKVCKRKGKCLVKGKFVSGYFLFDNLYHRNRWERKGSKDSISPVRQFRHFKVNKIEAEHHNPRGNGLFRNRTEINALKLK